MSRSRVRPYSQKLWNNESSIKLEEFLRSPTLESLAHWLISFQCLKKRRFPLSCRVVGCKAAGEYDYGIETSCAFVQELQKHLPEKIEVRIANDGRLGVYEPSDKSYAFRHPQKRVSIRKELHRIIKKETLAPLIIAMTMLKERLEGDSVGDAESEEKA